MAGNVMAHIGKQVDDAHEEELARQFYFDKRTLKLTEDLAQMAIRERRASRSAFVAGIRNRGLLASLAVVFGLLVWSDPVTAALGCVLCAVIWTMLAMLGVSK